MQISNFCLSKGTKNKINKQDVDWEKIFTTNMFDKRLVS